MTNLSYSKSQADDLIANRFNIDRQKSHIAYFCGYSLVYDDDYEEVMWKQSVACYSEPPQYTRSLDALFEAEHHLSEEQRRTYMDWTHTLTGLHGKDSWSYFRVPLRIKVEAFLRTIDCWEK